MGVASIDQVRRVRVSASVAKISGLGLLLHRHRRRLELNVETKNGVVLADLSPGRKWGTNFGME